MTPRMITTVGAAIFLGALASFAPAHASDPFYLEQRNDLGLIAHCTQKGMLPDDAADFFAAGIDAVFGVVAPTEEADLHERKGRDGISYLQGEEQSLEDLAAANEVTVREVCEQYKLQISLGKRIKEQQQAQ